MKKLYKIAMNSLNVKAEECIFIDNKIKNVEAAERLGLRGVYLYRKVNNLKIIESELDANSLQV